MCHWIEIWIPPIKTVIDRGTLTYSQKGASQRAERCKCEGKEIEVQIRTKQVVLYLEYRIEEYGIHPTEKHFEAL